MEVLYDVRAKIPTILYAEVHSTAEKQKFVEDAAFSERLSALSLRRAYLDSGVTQFCNIQKYRLF